MHLPEYHTRTHPSASMYEHHTHARTHAYLHHEQRAGLVAVHGDDGHVLRGEFPRHELAGQHDRLEVLVVTRDGGTRLVPAETTCCSSQTPSAGLPRPAPSVHTRFPAAPSRPIPSCLRPRTIRISREPRPHSGFSAQPHFTSTLPHPTSTLPHPNPPHPTLPSPAHFSRPYIVPAPPHLALFTPACLTLPC